MRSNKKEFNRKDNLKEKENRAYEISTEEKKKMTERRQRISKKNLTERKENI